MTGFEAEKVAKIGELWQRTFKGNVCFVVAIISKNECMIVQSYDNASQIGSRMSIASNLQMAKVEIATLRLRGIT